MGDLKKRHLFSICLGSALEWVEYSLFAIFIVIISDKFFPFQSEFLRHFCSWLLFASGLVARLIGLYIFNKTYTSLGHVRSLSLSLNLMALSTTLIGVLPTYHAIGVLAPILLLSLRVIQGISMSGEFLSATLLLYKASSQKQKVFYPALILVCASCGILLSSLIAKGCMQSTLPEALKWRIPFIIGGTISLIGWHIRTSLPKDIDGPISNNKTVTQVRLLSGMNNTTFLPIFLLSSTLCTNTYLCQSYFISYLTRLDYDYTFALSAQSFGQLITLFLTLTLSMIIKFEDIKKHIIICLSILTLSPHLFFILIHSGQYYGVFKAQILFGLTHGYLCSIILTFICTLFDKDKDRFLGIGLPWSMALVTFGAFTPNIAMILEALTQEPRAGAWITSLLATITIATLTYRFFIIRQKNSSNLKSSN